MLQETRTYFTELLRQRFEHHPPRRFRLRLPQRTPSEALCRRQSDTVGDNQTGRKARRSESPLSHWSESLTSPLRSPETACKRSRSSQPPNAAASSRRARSSKSPPTAPAPRPSCAASSSTSAFSAITSRRHRPAFPPSSPTFAEPRASAISSTSIATTKAAPVAIKPSTHPASPSKTTTPSASGAVPTAGWQRRQGRPHRHHPRGATFTDLATWQQIYTQRPQHLARGFATHFLTYATGAPPRFSDEAALDEIAKKTTNLRSIIREVVLSRLWARPCRLRRNPH
jgi:hypothetical protein